MRTSKFLQKQLCRPPQKRVSEIIRSGTEFALFYILPRVFLAIDAHGTSSSVSKNLGETDDCYVAEFADSFKLIHSFSSDQLGSFPSGTAMSHLPEQPFRYHSLSLYKVLALTKLFFIHAFFFCSSWTPR